MRRQRLSAPAWLYESGRLLNGLLLLLVVFVPLERLFVAVDMSVDFYLADPPFYRTLWAAVFDCSDDVRDPRW